MGALASSGVTVHDVWKGGGTSGRKYKYLDVTLTLSTQGGLTNNIPASLFGLTKIVGTEGFRTTSSVRGELGPNLSTTLNGTLLAYYDSTAATDADRNNPVDVTATVRGIVYGLE